MSAQPTGRVPYYGDASSPRRYQDQAYNEYPPMQSKSPDFSVDHAISRMNNLRISDNRQEPPPRSNSTPVTGTNLLPITPQRATSQRAVSSRPRPNQEPQQPQHQPELQSDEY